MKIMIDARFYGLENGGLGRYTINLIKELQRLDTKNEYTVLLRDKYFNQIKWPNNWKKINAEARHYSFKEQAIIPAIVSKEKPDITHFTHFNVPLGVRHKFVTTIHDLLMHKKDGKKATTLPLPFYYIKRLGYGRVFRHAVINSEAVMVPTSTVKQELVSFYKIKDKKVHVTYEGVDESFRKRIQDTQIVKKHGLINGYFIYAGNAYPHKNIERTLEAFSYVSDRSIKFVVVTPGGEFYSNLAATIKKHALADRVVLTGFVSDKDLLALYSGAIAFVYPSLSEGFGLPGLEAMAAGTMVLASEIPVFKEVYKDSALYFNPHNFESIARAMEKAIKLEQSERKQYLKKGKELVGQYSWKKMAEQTLNIYKRAVRQ